jgi:hypothetical protein
MVECPETEPHMSEATEQDQQPAGEFRTPEQEQAAIGADVPPAYEMPLEDINPVNAHLFSQNRWQEVFERLRKEDPVHFNQIRTAGRYWSLTRYRDIKKVDSDWETFSSERRQHRLHLSGPTAPRRATQDGPGRGRAGQPGKAGAAHPGAHMPGARLPARR